MKSLFIFIMLIISSGIAFAQTPEILLQEAQTLATKGLGQEAHTKLQKALEQCATNKTWDKYATGAALDIEVLLNVGDYEKAIEVAENHATALTNANAKPSNDLANVYKNWGKGYYALQEDGQAIIQLSKALEIRQQVQNNNPADLARDYNNLAILNRMLGRYTVAAQQLEKALTLGKANSELVTDVYTELAVTYHKKGSNDKALEYANLALLANEQQYGKNTKELANAYVNKGDILRVTNQLEEALSCLEKAVKIYEQLPNTETDIVVNHILAFQKMGGVYADNLKWNLAAEYYSKSLELSNKLLPNSDYHAYSILALVESQIQKRDFTLVQTQLNKAQTIANQNFAPKSVEMGDLYLNYAKFYSAQSNYPEALKYQQQQLVALVEGFDNQDIYSLPSEKDWANILSDEYFGNAVAFKARTFLALYKQTKQAKDLDAALKNVQYFDKYIDYLRKKSTEDNNVNWADFAIYAYENAIEICLAYNDDAHKKQAFYFAEKSKSLSLLEALQNSKAKSYAGIPQEVIEKEMSLKLEIAQLEQDLFQLAGKKNKNTIDKIAKLQETIISKKAAYEQFTKELETKYPTYYQSKYDTRLLGLDETRKLLDNEQAVLEYFVGDSSIFVFKISKNEFDIKQLPNTANLLTDVIKLRTSIYDYFLGDEARNDAAYAQYASDYAVTSYDFYQKLIAPMLPLPKRLIIIPDGELSYIPFESLLTEKVSDIKAFRTHPYLLRKYAISYCYSATLLNEMQSKKLGATTGDWLGFAPSFGTEAAAVVRGKRYALAPLGFNDKEIQRVQKMLGTGKTLIGKEATEAKFRELASQYKVLHFATHGMANNEFPDYSLIAFTEVVDSIENEFIYVSDLYNMQLNAELVVLSACETGIGKLQRGEGIMSLARGFSYAGTKSIFTTLWSVNDQATSQIVELFYKYLNKGIPKDEALQRAKLDFIESGNNLTAHPFLWSPYILIGDVRPISISGGSSWMYWAGGLALLVLAGGFVFLKRRKLQ